MQYLLGNKFGCVWRPVWAEYLMKLSSRKPEMVTIQKDTTTQIGAVRTAEMHFIASICYWSCDVFLRTDWLHVGKIFMLTFTLCWKVLYGETLGFPIIWDVSREVVYGKQQWTQHGTLGAHHKPRVVLRICGHQSMITISVRRDKSSWPTSILTSLPPRYTPQTLDGSSANWLYIHRNSWPCPKMNGMYLISL
jgi:hypothetical protein